MKNDSKQPATKSDLAKVQTEIKEDIQEVKLDTVVVKAELTEIQFKLRKFDNKLGSDLKAVEQRLGIEILKANARTDRLIESLRNDIREGHSRLFNTLDAFMGKTQAVRQTTLIFDKILGDHGSKHERRINILESSR